jgi:hypothetical protein
MFIRRGEYWRNDVGTMVRTSVWVMDGLRIVRSIRKDGTYGRSGVVGLVWVARDKCFRSDPFSIKAVVGRAMEMVRVRFEQ